MSTYGKASLILSPKNWLKKGADKLMVKVLFFSKENLASFIIEVGHTVKKKPFRKNPIQIRKIQLNLVVIKKVYFKKDVKILFKIKNWIFY